MSLTESPKLVLASASPRRMALLQQIGIEPDRLQPVDLDETPRKRESPRGLAHRLAQGKAQAARQTLVAMAKALDAEKATEDDGNGTGHIDRDNQRFDNAFILAADTVVAVGRTALPKADTVQQAADCLERLSGRAHRVYTGVALMTPRGGMRKRLVETKVRFKNLSQMEMDAYIATGEWRGKAGGYAIQGLASAFVTGLQGSYSSVVGLPMHETTALLQGEGYPVVLRWLQKDL